MSTDQTCNMVKLQLFYTCIKNYYVFLLVTCTESAALFNEYPCDLNPLETDLRLDRTRPWYSLKKKQKRILYIYKKTAEKEKT